MAFSDIGIVCFSGLELFENPIGNAKFGPEFDKILRLEKVKIPIRIIEITRAHFLYIGRPRVNSPPYIYAPFAGFCF